MLLPCHVVLLGHDLQLVLSFFDDAIALTQEIIESLDFGDVLLHSALGLTFFDLEKVSVLDEDLVRLVPVHVVAQLFV